MLQKLNMLIVQKSNFGIWHTENNNGNGKHCYIIIEQFWHNALF